jgi:hypothetical protein
MAYREPLKDTRALSMFATSIVLEAVEKALEDGRKVEMEHTSFSDPGPDESRVLIDGIKLYTIPGY